jgi:integrase/recombinase XerD
MSRLQPAINLDDIGAPITAHLNEMRRQNRRPGTIDQRRRTLRRLERHLDGRDLLDATGDQLSAWIFDDRALTPEAQATELSHLRQFYRWTIRTGLATGDPTALIDRPRLPKRHPRPMDQDDLAVAIDMAPARIRPWLLLAAYAGLRCIEIAQLRAEDILRRNDPPVILIVESKGGDSSVVPLCSHLRTALGTCDLPSKGWLFLRRDGVGGHVTAHLVSQLANRYLHDIGITDTIHQARHWYGTETLRAAGGNLRVTQEALRHSSIVSTQRYTFVRPTEVAAALERLPSLS